MSSTTTFAPTAGDSLRILGVTANPDGRLTTQQVRNLLMDLGDHAADFWYLVRDRAGQFTEAFDAVLADAGTTDVVLMAAASFARPGPITQRI